MVDGGHFLTGFYQQKDTLNPSNIRVQMMLGS